MVADRASGRPDAVGARARALQYGISAMRAVLVQNPKSARAEETAELRVAFAAIGWELLLCAHKNGLEQCIDLGPDVVVVAGGDGTIGAVAKRLAGTQLPMAIVPTFVFMWLFGGTINLMSMGGLAVAIGLVIDDAVVVVENIHRRAGEGGSSVIDAVSQLMAPLVSSTLTTVVVFASPKKDSPRSFPIGVINIPVIRQNDLDQLTQTFILPNRPFRFPGDGGTMIMGDALINFEPYDFTLLPAKYCSNAKLMRRSLPKLLDYSFDRMLFAHGTPIVSGAWQRLEELLRQA